MPSPSVTSTAAPNRPVQLVELDDLMFDLHNPRYGTGAAKIGTERDALNHIVRMFGVYDVLSSIAVNGFFDSEPLVGIKTPGESRIKIVEGNRRLAACLILSGDERAADQTRLHEQFTGDDYPARTGEPIPVIVYEGPTAMREVLPYLGVRHIVGFLEWDSYAKAAWVDSVITTEGFSLTAIQEMIGDKNNTIPRMLAGYRFVNQLIHTGHFKPEQSQRKGRGSNPDYPFSWIYTALDNPPIREFVNFQDTGGVPDKEPVPKDKLEDGGLLLTFMFGDKIRGIAAVVEDSRELGELAKVINNPTARNRMKDGKKLRVVIQEGRPEGERLHEGFLSIADQLRDLSGLIVPGQLTADDAETLVNPAKNVSNLSKKILSDLRTIVIGSIDTNLD